MNKIMTHIRGRHVGLPLQVVVVVLLLAGCGAGGTITVEDAWARAAGAGDITGAFFTLDNGGEDDVLLSADSDVAEAVEIHQTVMEGDIMSMVMQESVAVPTGELAFQPGSLHVMLIGLTRDLNAGDEFALTLNFEQAGVVVVSVEVLAP
jgi:copper(I)-binding protein